MRVFISVLLVFPFLLFKVNAFSNRFHKLKSRLHSPNYMNDRFFDYAVVTTAASISLKYENNTIIKSLSTPVTAMLITVIMTNIGVLPAQGSVYLKGLVDMTVKIATPLLLFNANLEQTYKDSGNSLLISFLLGTCGTILGSIIGYTVFGRSLGTCLGQVMIGDGWKVVSALTAKNIGGGLNYMGVANGLHLSPAALSLGLAMDNILGLIYFPIISLLAERVPKDEHTTTITNTTTISTNVNTAVYTYNNTINSSNDDILTYTTTTNNTYTTMTTLDTTNTTPTIQLYIQALSTCFAITALSNYLSPILHILPISLTTLLTVLFASLFPAYFRLIIPSADMIGRVLLMLFFASIGNLSGTISDISKLSSSILPLLGFNSVLYIVHFLFLYLVFKMFKLPLRDILIASNANIGNAATASSLALSKGWTRSVVPAMLVGCLGNAYGTGIGIGLGEGLYRHMHSAPH